MLAALRWCFGPHGHLPRFRVRYLRLRLHLRLHPGRGHASAFELWLRWGRLAAFRRSGRSRRSLPVWRRLRIPVSTRCVLGRAHYRHGLRVPLEEHVLVMAPPRTGKTGLLARIILHYPGPVVSHHDQARRVPAHLRDPVPARPGARVQPAADRRGAVDVPVEPGRRLRRTRPPRSAAPTGSRTRSTCPAPRTPRSGPARPPTTCAACSTPPPLAGGDMRLVARWALGSAEPAEDILAQAGAEQWAAELAELRGEAQKTAATIKMVLSRALGFMTDPALARSVLPGGDGGGVDIDGVPAPSPGRCT